MNEDSKIQILEDTVDHTIDSKLRNALDDAVSFSGTPQYFAVGFVDIANSTNITAQLSHDKASLYYSTFLNSMSVIVNAFEGKVVKNIGDGLMFSFQENQNFSKNKMFVDILECGLKMIHSRDLINERLYQLDLPEMSYRVSADYGRLLVADSKTSFNKDLFGTPVNSSYKINRIANPNSMVIGQNLFQYVESFNRYEFREISPCMLLAKKKYEVYEVNTLIKTRYF